MSFRCPRCTTAFAAPSTPIRIVTDYRTIPESVSDAGATSPSRREIAAEVTICLACAYRAQPENAEVLRRMAGEEAKRRRPAPQAEAT